MMKTPVTVLQEMMIKMGYVPEYECLSQTGPQHQALFKYRCIACGESVTAHARSKKEAKQEAARLMLEELSRKGHSVPPPYGLAVAASSSHDEEGAARAVDARSYVALLRELCAEYRLGDVCYELVGDTGPPHLRRFTELARLGQHQRLATATTKKAARQAAARDLYLYLRDNLARVTHDFDEEEALVRAHDKAMERPREDEPAARRPDLRQRLADYPWGLTEQLEPAAAGRAAWLLQQGRGSSPERALGAAAEALRCAPQWGALGPLALLELAGAAPALVFAAPSRAAAAERALAHLRRALRRVPPAAPT